ACGVVWDKAPPEGGGGGGRSCALTMRVFGPAHCTENGATVDVMGNLAGDFNLVDHSSIKVTEKSKGSETLLSKPMRGNSDFNWVGQYSISSSKKGATITFTATYKCTDGTPGPVAADTHVYCATGPQKT